MDRVHINDQFHSAPGHFGLDLRQKLFDESVERIPGFSFEEHLVAMPSLEFSQG
jgi:hypothetical protein